MQKYSIESFKQVLAKDFNLNLTKEVKLKLPASKEKIKAFTAGQAMKTRIFDGVQEYPFLLPTMQRNEEMLSKGIELRITGAKGIYELMNETGYDFKPKPCQICEGNGWYSNGTQYTYKDICITI